MRRSLLACTLFAFALAIPSEVEGQAPLNTWCLGGAPVCFDAFAFSWTENFVPGDPSASSWDSQMTGVFSGGPLPSAPGGGAFAWRYSFDMIGWDGLTYRFQSQFTDFTLGTTTSTNGTWWGTDTFYSPDTNSQLSVEKSDQPVTIADVVGIEIRQNDFTGTAVIPIAGCGPTGPACTPVRVPEPASLPLLLVAGALFAWQARRRSEVQPG